jgi:hypothetical protein
MPWDIIGNVLDKIIPDKSERDAAKLKMIELQQSGAFKEDEMRYAAISTEAQSQHLLVALARPSFLYVVYIFLLAAIPFGIASAFAPIAAEAMAAGVKAWLAAIPEEMWWLMGAGYLGYVKKRSDDKETMVNPAREKSFLQKLF